MGWSSGTTIFDRSIDLFFAAQADDGRVPSNRGVDKFVLGMYDMLRDQDWDTVDESDYIGLVESALRRRQ